MFKKIIKATKNPKKFLLYLLDFKIFHVIPDKTYIKIKFYLTMGYKLDLKDPKSYNEKLQYLKLYDRNPNYTQLVDKYAVRQFISNTIGGDYLIPLLGVYNSFDEINFNELPNQFVLKPTHTSGNVYICKDKSLINYKKLKKEINKWMKRKYYWLHREWPYKNIKPKIICEKYMVDESGIELKDYKFFCFDGTPQALFVATDRGTDTRFDFFDIHFNHLSVVQHYKNAKKDIVKPIGFDKMVELSKKLSKNFPHVRVDFYNINGKIYFGELTFYHFSGFVKFEPEKYDYWFGSLINIL